MASCLELSLLEFTAKKGLVILLKKNLRTLASITGESASKNQAYRQKQDYGFVVPLLLFLPTWTEALPTHPSSMLSIVSSK